MDENDNKSVIDEFLGSAKIFAAAVEDVIEDELLREVADNQISVSQLKLLKLVGLTEARTIGDVASFLGVSNAAASKAVDKLVRMMLLRRSEGANDRRAINLSLTQPSRRLLAAYDVARERKLREIFSSSSRAELNRASVLLDRLSARIVQQSSKAEKLCLQCGIYFREKCVMSNQLRRECRYHQHIAHGEPQDESDSILAAAEPAEH